MRHKPLGYLLLGLTLSVLMAATWNGTFEGQPTGSELASTLDEYINEDKLEVRQRAEVEHLWGGSTDDNGLHAVGSARCFIQAAQPTDIQAGTAALGPYNSSAGTDASTLLTTDEPGATTRDIGAGRCWIDTDGPDDTANTPDDYSLAIWNETTNDFVYVGAVDATNGTDRFLFDPGESNLVFNGQFETTDGSGVLTAVTTVPLGWTGTGTPAHTYAASAGAQGDGVAYVQTAGADNSGISQTLKGLKGSTTYYAVARATPSVNGDSCTLRTTGATTNLPGAGMANVIASGTSATTLSGFFVTDATPTDVVLILEADATGDICTFDYVGVYETSTDRKGVPDPKLQIASATNATDDAISTTEDQVQDSAGDWTRAVTVPRPGYSILVIADLGIVNTGGDCDTGVLTLQEDIDGGGYANVRVTGWQLGIGTDDGGMVMLHYVRANPNAGSKYSYQLLADCDAGTATINGDNINADATHDANSMFSVLLLPTG